MVVFEGVVVRGTLGTCGDDTVSTVTVVVFGLLSVVAGGTKEDDDDDKDDVSNNNGLGGGIAPTTRCSGRDAADPVGIIKMVRNFKISSLRVGSSIIRSNAWNVCIKAVPMCC